MSNFYYHYLAISDITADETKYCKSCKTSRRVCDFVRKRGQQTKEFSMCNICSLNAKKNRSESSSIEQNMDALESEEIGQSNTEIRNEINDEGDF